MVDIVTLLSTNQNVHGSLKANGNKSSAHPRRCATKQMN